MQKKILIPLIVILITVAIAVGFQSTPSDKKNEPVFHVTLANPELFDNGVYSGTFVIGKGEFLFRFVPNGDSPRKLTISLKGDDFEFYEDFKLNGTLHETEISEYYTWDYDGGKSIHIPNQKEIFIQINPNGNENGSVSVDIIRK